MEEKGECCKARRTNCTREELWWQNHIYRSCSRSECCNWQNHEERTLERTLLLFLLAARISSNTFWLYFFSDSDVYSDFISGFGTRDNEPLNWMSDVMLVYILCHPERSSFENWKWRQLAFSCYLEDLSLLIQRPRVQKKTRLGVSEL